MSAISAVSRTVCATTLVLCFAILAACGGGGGGGSSGGPGSGGPGTVGTSTVAGRVIKGPVSGAAVNLYSVASDGTKTLVAITRTDSAGGFSFSNPIAAGTVSLIEASGGTYIDEYTGQQRSPDTPLRAAFVANSTSVNLAVTVFSELAVRRLDSASPRRYSAADISAQNNFTAASLGVPDVLDIRAVDLRISQDLSAVRDVDFVAAIFIGGFSALAKQLDDSAGNNSLDRAVIALDKVLLSDPFNDDLGPKFVRALIRFIEVTALPESSKGVFRGSFLTLSSTPLSSAQAAAFLPTGSATGAVKSFMADGRYQLVSEQSIDFAQPLDARFNARGALYSYQFPSYSSFDALYSASVGELYGDSEVNIGRWHGGEVATVVSSGVSSTRFLAPNADLHYAVAVQATGLPNCGARNYRLVAQTRPTVSNGLPDALPKTEGLGDGSIVAIQFIGASPYVAMDLQMRKADGSVDSFKSRASLDIPAVYGFPVNAAQRFDLSLDNNPLVEPSYNLKHVVRGQAMLAGEGGRKIVLYLKPRIGPDLTTTPTDQFVAVFEATDPGVLPGTCVTPATDPGTPIVPAPVAGTYWVFGQTVQTTSLFYGGTASDVTFTTRGALATATHNGSGFTIPEPTPTYDLAGNSYAVIGRVNGPVTEYSVTRTDALAYAVARRPTNALPTTGTRRYTLISATAPVASIWSNAGTTIMGTGTVNAATIDILFGQSPYGVINSINGGVVGSIQGSVAGKDFTLTNVVLSSGLPDIGVYHMDEAWFQVGFVSSSNAAINIVEGALAGPNGEYLVIHYTTTSGVMSIDGTALLRQQ